LLNLQVRTVKVEAIAPRFRPLQDAQLLYLGTNAGARVLYNRTLDRRYWPQAGRWRCGSTLSLLQGVLL
jgi:hypothetical protein